MQRRNNKYRHSQFVGKCGTIIPLPRVHRQREKGHIKDLWCPKCQMVHGFKEFKETDHYLNMCGEVIKR